MKELSVFEQDGRRAVVLKNGDMFMVEMYENGHYRRTQDIVGYNLQYAEDCAENWILKVIKE